MGRLSGSARLVGSVAKTLAHCRFAAIRIDGPGCTNEKTKGNLAKNY